MICLFILDRSIPIPITKYQIPITITHYPYLDPLPGAALPHHLDQLPPAEVGAVKGANRKSDVEEIPRRQVARRQDAEPFPRKWRHPQGAVKLSHVPNHVGVTGR